MDITGIEDRRLSCHGPNIIQVMTMFRKTTMATLVAAVAILGVVAVLQTGGLMMSLPSMRVLWTNFRMHSIMVEA